MFGGNEYHRHSPHENYQGEGCAAFLLTISMGLLSDVYIELLSVCCHVAVNLLHQRKQ